MAHPSGPERGAELRNHWRWRPDWTAGRVCLWWYLTLDRHPALGELHRRVGSRLQRSAAVDVIPRRWLHLTLHEVGYAELLPSHRLDELLSGARRLLRTLPGFTLRLERPACMPGAVVLPAAPTGPVIELRHRLDEATRRVSGDAAPGLHPVPPHVSLAYVNRAAAARDVLAHLDDEELPTVDVPTSRVTLAAVTRRDRSYQWTERGAVRLAPPAGRPGATIVDP